MSLQTARFEGQQVVNNFNIFVDTEKTNLVGHGSSKGDDTLIHLEGNSIEAGDGEIIRLSLTNFTMFNNIYGVNVNNSKFRVRAGGGTSTGNTLLLIPHKNYKTTQDVADAFATKLSAELLTQAKAQSGTSGSTTISHALNGLTSGTSGTGAMGATDDRLLDITFTTTSAHNLTSVVVQCNENDGDSYALLGGDRLDSDHSSANTTFQSFQITIPSTTTIRVQGLYPMQRMTDPYVYLRCGSTNNNLEMSVLSRPRSTTSSGAFNVDIMNSDILGKISRDTEFINYHSEAGEYFINLQQKRLSTLRLFLTDKNGRPLGRLDNSRLNTAAGLENAGDFVGTKQSTLGNLYFTAVVKCEIVKVRQPNYLQSEKIPKPLPARQAQGVYVWEDGGNPKY